MRHPRKLLAILAALAVGVIAGALIFGPTLTPPPASTGEAPRRSGAPSTGASLTEALLDQALPPAPADAVGYDVREPLRNGHAVERKSRWLWLPEGARLEIVRTASGGLAMTVPAGTTMWKDFHLATPQGARLIERRILRKVSSTPAENGGLLNGGWRFWTAHHLPRAADGVHGFDGATSDLLDDAGERRWFFTEAEWLPTQAKSATTAAVFRTVSGRNIPFVFPGKTNCEYCHAGATAAFANPAGAEVISFALHPENLTAESFRAIAARGWIAAEPEVIVQLSREPAPPADPATARLVGIFRNNCLSCHSPAAQAAGRETAFVLVPGVDYARGELQGRLAARARFMGPRGKPMVSSHDPAGSELLLRLKGEEGRRRMPPAEGGVPDPDLELTRLVEEWIAL